MRRSCLALAFVVGIHLFWTTPESSAQLIDRLKGKSRSQAKEQAPTQPAAEPRASPSVQIQDPPADTAEKPSTDGGATSMPAEWPFRAPMSSNAVPTKQTKPTSPTPVNRTKANSTGAIAATPLISIETIGPAEINIGRRASFTIVVRNDGNSIARDLVVQATLPSGAELLKAEPKPEVTNQIMQCRVSELLPKAERQIKFEIIPRQQGAMDFKTRAFVSTSSSAPVQVRRPDLAVKFSGPTEAMFGEVVTFTATITNTGDGPVEDISIAQLLPVRLAGGEITQTEAVFEHHPARISQLLPGQSQEVELPAEARSEGTMRAEILVRAADGLEARAAAVVCVRRPSIEVTVMGPVARDVQRSAGYVIFVTNTGEVVADNVVVTVLVPDGLSVVGIQRATTFDKKANSLTWNLVTVAPGSTETLKFQAKTLTEGEHRVQISVVGDHAIRAETAHVTRVAGKADLAMSVEESPGPIELGGRASYAIRVKNLGTTAAYSISVRARLPKGVEFAESPDCDVSGSTIEFHPIDQLDANQELVLQLTAVGNDAGDQVIRFTAQCESLSREVCAETSTLFYKPKK